MKKSLFLLISLAGVLIFSTAMATTIDTTSTFTTGGGASLGPLNSNSYSWDVGQTFTLQSGDDTNLDSVTFYLANNSGESQQVTVSLYEGSSLIAGGTTIQLGDTTGNDSATDYDEYLDCMINYAASGNSISLTVGTEYLWVLEGTSGTDVLVGAVNNNPYANGAAYVRSAGTTSWQNWHTEKDVAFIMELSGDSGGQDAVPEPATMLLFGIGLLGVAGIGRKQKA